MVDQVASLTYQQPTYGSEIFQPMQEMNRRDSTQGLFRSLERNSSLDDLPFLASHLHSCSLLMSRLDQIKVELGFLLRSEQHDKCMTCYWRDLEQSRHHYHLGLEPIFHVSSLVVQYELECP